MSFTSDIRLLVVDHEPHTTFSLASELRKLGRQYIVDTTNSAQEAILRIQQIEYSLIIVDYKMPEVDGTAFIKKIQSICTNMRIIVMSDQTTARFRRDIVSRLNLEAYLEKPFSPEKIRQLVAHSIEKIQEREVTPPPVVKPESQHPLTDRLQQYRANTNARCVLVLSKSGHIMDIVGDTSDLDTNSISALVAANFMAGIELLGRMLGNDSVFKTSYYEGPNYNIYAHSIDSNYLLAIIFSHESKQGVIRFYVNKLIEDLIPILRDKVMFSQNVTTNSLEEGFSQGMISDLDKLFAVPIKSSTK